ncbi:SDR family oxidoreductase [bacterium]|nr:SDR family oxidoreductase [bacterium]
MNYTLITGASSGIGFELAHVFAKNNHNLVLVARSEEKLKALKAEIEKTSAVVAEVIAIDLSKQNAAEDLFNAIQKKNISIDVLVNNAGFGDHGLFLTEDKNKIEEMILLNILTLTKLTKLFLPAMVEKQHGKILNVASTAAFQPGPLMSVYYATKAYVLSFTEGLYEELKGTGVSTTAVCPGPTVSGFQDAANMSDVALLNTMKLPTSKDVAEFAFTALMNNEAVAIHGFVNSIMARSTGLVPRSLIRKLVMKLQEKRS